MRALVTGATGFVGSHLVEQLIAAGMVVRGLARSDAKAAQLDARGVESVRGDLSCGESLQSAAVDVDVVFHLAARVTDWGRWPQFESATVRGTENLLRAVARAGVKRFVHFSTVNVYDDRFARQVDAVREDAPCTGDRALGHYSRAKVQAERAVWEYHRRGDLAVTVLRPALIYGPRDPVILPRLIDYLRGPVTAWIGRENPVIDPIYVHDVARCALAAAESDRAVGEAYNVSPPWKTGVREFCRTLCDALAIRPPRWTMPYQLAALTTSVMDVSARLLNRRHPPPLTKAGFALFTEDRHHDPAKAREHLSWQATVTTQEGVRMYAHWLSGQPVDSWSAQGVH